MKEQGAGDRGQVAGKIRVVPIECRADGSAADPRLWTAVEEFCKAQLGYAPNFGRCIKSWAAVEENAPGDCKKILGVVCLAWRVDVPMFHIAAPGNSRDLEDVKQCYRARDGLIERAKNYLADNGAGGHEVTICVAPEARQAWEKFFQRLGAKDANRVVLEI